MRDKEEIDKDQIMLEPVCMGDMIEKGNICRAIVKFAKLPDLEKLKCKIRL